MSTEVSQPSLAPDQPTSANDRGDTSVTCFFHSAVFLRFIRIDACAQYSLYEYATILIWRDSWVVSSLGQLHSNHNMNMSCGSYVQEFIPRGQVTLQRNSRE